jgi:thiamine biosynthesis protein ThiS
MASGLWLMVVDVKSGIRNPKSAIMTIMQIICNDEEKEIRPGATIAALLQELGVTPDTVFVECNGVIIRRDDYETHELSEGARLELIRFVGGG